MDGPAVKEFAERLQGPQLVGDLLVRPERWTVEDPQALIKPGPSAETLKVSTLAAVSEYLKANKDKLDLDTLVVHVASPFVVRVFGALRERARDRENFVNATAADYTDGFLGKYLSLEDMIIGLQVRFVADDARKDLLGLLSGVKSSSVKTALDDGMTQVVEARHGVAMVTDVPVPNPVTLTPWRTFREVPRQPSSPFVLRLQSGKSPNGLPEAALFAADGDAWRLVAISLVRDWLVEHLPDGVSVLA